MSVSAQDGQSFVSSYTHPEIADATFKIGLASPDRQAQAMLAGLQDHPKTPVAQILSEWAYETGAGGCEAVVYRLAYPVAFDGSDDRRAQLEGLAKAVAMDCGLQFSEDAQPYELAMPLDGMKPGDAVLLAGVFGGLSFVCEAWVVRLTVLDNTFPDDDSDDDGTDFSGLDGTDDGWFDGGDYDYMNDR